VGGSLKGVDVIENINTSNMCVIKEVRIKLMNRHNIGMNRQEWALGMPE